MWSTTEDRQRQDERAKQVERAEVMEAYRTGYITGEQARRHLAMLDEEEE